MELLHYDWVFISLFSSEHILSLTISQDGRGCCVYVHPLFFLMPGFLFSRSPSLCLTRARALVRVYPSKAKETAMSTSTKHIFFSSSSSSSSLPLLIRFNVQKKMSSDGLLLVFFTNWIFWLFSIFCYVSTSHIEVLEFLSLTHTHTHFSMFTQTTRKDDFKKKKNHARACMHDRERERERGKGERAKEMHAHAHLFHRFKYLSGELNPILSYVDVLLSSLSRFDIVHSFFFFLSLSHWLDERAQ